MFCTVAAEWCVTAWGASFAEEAADVSADTAVALMFGYFGGVLVGRASGAVLARRFAAARLLAVALVVAAAGFAILWPSASSAQVFAGPVRDRHRAREPVPVRSGRDASRLAPDRAQLASSRAVLAGSTAVLARASDDRGAGRRHEHHQRAAGRAGDAGVGCRWVGRDSCELNNGSSRGKGAAFPPRGGEHRASELRAARAGLACRSPSSYGPLTVRGAPRSSVDLLRISRKRTRAGGGDAQTFAPG